MKNKIAFIVMLLTLVFISGGCLHNPDASNPNYVITDPYCWHKNQDGKWNVIGLGNQCPSNTRAIGAL